MDDVVNVAVVGVGGWGKNLARNYHQMPEARLLYMCDLSREKLESVARQLPGPKLTTDYDEVLNDPDVAAVVIGTTSGTHYSLGKRALEAGKDVYVEKPFVLHVDQARELIDIAERRARVLMVGHLLEYHPGMSRLKG